MSKYFIFFIVSIMTILASGQNYASIDMDPTPYASQECGGYGESGCKPDNTSTKENNEADNSTDTDAK